MLYINITDIKQRWNHATSNFSNNRYVSGGREFLASNTLAAKFVFLILVIIGFIIILRLGTTLLGWMFSPSRNPKLVHCIKDAKKFLLIPQNPNGHGSKPIMRSVDQRGGLEFTWTVWLYIDDLEYKSGQRKHIFHKGNDKLDADHTAYPNNAPGMYLHSTRNTIIIVMNTFDKILEEVEINDIPLHKWICVAVRLRGKVMDVYVNGDIVLSDVFTSIPRQNYCDVYVNMNGGYSGHLSD